MKRDGEHSQESRLPRRALIAALGAIGVALFIVDVHITLQRRPLQPPPNVDGPPVLRDVPGLVERPLFPPQCRAHSADVERRSWCRGRLRSWAEAERPDFLNVRSVTIDGEFNLTLADFDNAYGVAPGDTATRLSVLASLAARCFGGVPCPDGGYNCPLRTADLLRRLPAACKGVLPNLRALHIGSATLSAGDLSIRPSESEYDPASISW